MKTAIVKIVLFTFFLTVFSIASAQSNYRIIAQTNEVYDSLTFSWKKDSIAFVYSNGRGSDITADKIQYDTLHHYYSNGSVYQLENRNIRTYNAQDSLLSHTYQITKGSTLQNDEQFVYTYDSNNNKVSETWKVWDTTALKWISDARQLYSYNGNNYKISETFQIWDTASSSWRNEVEHSYSYNAQGKMDNETIKLWEASSSTWDLSWQVNYTYNSSGKLILREQQSWMNNAWENSNRTEYTYDSNLWLEEELYSNWDLWSSSWEKEQRLLYTHVANNNYYSVMQMELFRNGVWQKMQQIKFEFTSFNRIDSIKILLWNSSSWVLLQKGKLFYEQYNPTGISEVALKHLDAKIYPNPAIDEIRVDFNNPEAAPAKLNIYDVSGRLLRQNNYGLVPSGPNEMSTNVQEFKSGIYIFELKFPEYMVQGQFMKK